MNHALVNRLIAFADDGLILAHRNGEWIGHAPILEEDIALANLAQDELGQAMLYYDMVTALTGQTGDQLAFFRESADFRNVQLVELPKGDWAFTILRQYLYDAYQHTLYAELVNSRYQPLADAAGKIYKEELYHLRHTHVWVARLGLGSTEANGRMQRALDTLWPYTGQLFTPLPTDQVVVADGAIPDLAQLLPRWEQIVIPHLAESGLIIPADEPLALSRSEHTPHLRELLYAMQLVARADQEASW
jgi:ring-1,2-phenylacetyl-CoA epoxidase subunit PaaC